MVAIGETYIYRGGGTSEWEEKKVFISNDFGDGRWGGWIADNPEASRATFYENELHPVYTTQDEPVAEEPEQYTVRPLWDLRVVALQSATLVCQGASVRTNDVLRIADEFLEWLEDGNA